MEYIHQLAYIAMILLIGTLSSVLAYTLKTSDIFILLLTGMIFSGLGLLTFDKELIIIISILALIFVVFNSSFKFNIKELKKHFFDALKLNISYFILCMVFLTIAVIYIFNLSWTFNSLLLASLFSVLAYGTDPIVILSFFQGSKNKIVEIMEIESIINTPITVIVSFLILTSLAGPKFQLITQVTNPFISFVQSIIVGILVAVIIGWIVIAILKNNYFGDLTHLGILTSAIIVYVGSEYLGGSGVLSIAIFGLLFGNSHISHLVEIERFESILTNSIKILTFMLLGTIIIISPEYIIKGTLIFIIYLIIRLISVIITFPKEKMGIRKILFITLNVPKGVDVDVILLLIISIYTGIRNIEIVINLTMLMIIYTIALSSITSQFSSYFLKKEGTELLRLNVGDTVYDLDGQNVCLKRCLNRDKDLEKLNSIIYFPDGHLRYSWEHEGAILF